MFEVPDLIRLKAKLHHARLAELAETERALRRPRERDRRAEQRSRSPLRPGLTRL